MEWPILSQYASAGLPFPQTLYISLCVVWQRLRIVKDGTFLFKYYRYVTQFTFIPYPNTTVLLPSSFKTNPPRFFQRTLSSVYYTRDLFLVLVLLTPFLLPVKFRLRTYVPNHTVQILDIFLPYGPFLTPILYVPHLWPRDSLLIRTPILLLKSLCHLRRNLDPKNGP